MKWQKLWISKDTHGAERNESQTRIKQCARDFSSLENSFKCMNAHNITNYTHVLQTETGSIYVFQLLVFLQLNHVFKLYYVALVLFKSNVLFPN